MPKNNDNLMHLAKIDAILPHPRLDIFEWAVVGKRNIDVPKGRFNEDELVIVVEGETLIPMTMKHEFPNMWISSFQQKIIKGKFYFYVDKNDVGQGSAQAELVPVGESVFTWRGEEGEQRFSAGDDITELYGAIKFDAAMSAKEDEQDTAYKYKAAIQKAARLFVTAANVIDHKLDDRVYAEGYGPINKIQLEIDTLKQLREMIDMGVFDGVSTGVGFKHDHIIAKNLQKWRHEADGLIEAIATSNEEVVPVV